MSGWVELVVVVAIGGGSAAGPGSPRVVSAGVPDPPAPWHLAAGRAESCNAVAPHRFSFSVGFWLNLHNFLYKEARKRAGSYRDGPAAYGNTDASYEPARALTVKERRRWSAALDVYDDLVLTRAVSPDSIVTRVNNQLARMDAREDLSGLDLAPRFVQALERVAPVYRETWWPTHRRLGQAWADGKMRLLAAYETCLSRDLAAVLGTPWPDDPIRVDATVFASWYGAYTTFDPPHITMSSTAIGNQGFMGLEGLLHEAGHSMMSRVDSALLAASPGLSASDLGRASHYILFYTAGALVQHVEPDHVPFADRWGVWSRGTRSRRFRDGLEREWQPYLDGERTFDEAIRELVQRVPLSGSG